MKQQASRRRVEEFSEYARIAPPSIPGLQLPKEYVAMRFYFSDCFPDTPDNRRSCPLRDSVAQRR